MLNDAGLYRHSGNLGNGAFIIPAVGIAAAVVLGCVYAVVDVYMPVAGYISFILTALFALAVGYAVSWAAVAGKCRSVGFIKIMSFPIALLALYSSWAAFIYVLARRDLPEGEVLDPLKLFLAPSAVWGIAKLVGESGWYSLGSGAPVKGTTLWVLWALEALIVIGGVILISASGVEARVFCERCSRWCNEVKGKMRLGVCKEGDIYRRLSEGDMSALTHLPIVPASVSPYLRFDLKSCSSCTDTAVWQVHLVRHERTKQGKVEEKQHPLTKPRLLTAQQAQELERLASRPAIELPPAGAAEPASTDAT